MTGWLCGRRRGGDIEARWEWRRNTGGEEIHGIKHYGEGGDGSSERIRKKEEEKQTGEKNVGNKGAQSIL